MTSQVSAGTIFSLSASAPATFDSAGYGAVSFTPVGEVDDINGDIGRIYQIAKRNPLAFRGTVKKKTSYDDGNFTIGLAADYDDSGQDIGRAALASDNAYTFKIALPSGDIIYGQVLVAGFQVNISNVEAFFMGTITCEIVTSATGVGIVVVEN